MTYFCSVFMTCLNVGYIKQKNTFSVIIYTKKKRKKSSHAQNCVLRVLSFAFSSHNSSVLQVLTFVSIIFRGS